MNYVQGLVENDVQILFLLSFATILLVAIVVLINTKTLRNLIKNYEKFMENGFDGKSLETIIHKFSSDLEQYKQISSEMQNQIVKRDVLIKKVWEDNGVVVGRSLDTYISKIRKKLKDDDSIKIVNIHGVGYKLEIV